MGLSIKVSDIAPCQKELKVEVPLDLVDAEFEAVYDELKKVARVPGFRIGSAPRDLLEQHHGDSAKEQVLKRLVNRTLDEALSGRSDLDLIGNPEVTEVKFEAKKPLSYSARIEVAPKIPNGSYKGLKLTHPPFKVTDEQLNEVIARLREQQAELKDVLEIRPVAGGDYLLIDIVEQKKGAQPVKRKDVVIVLDLDRDPEGFLKQLVGMNPGNEKSVTLKGDLTVTVTIKTIKKRELPSLDDAFAKSVGQFETLESLKTSIRENLEKESERHRRSVLEQAAGEKLLEGWTFDVPPSVVASQARRILKERAMEMVQHGMPVEQVQEQAEMLTEQAKLDALKQVKIFFVLRQVASIEKLEATEQETEERLRQLAEGMGASLDDFRKDIEQRELMDEVVWGIIRSKAYDLIIREADVKETKQ